MAQNSLFVLTLLWWLNTNKQNKQSQPNINIHCRSRIRRAWVAKVFFLIKKPKNKDFLQLTVSNLLFSATKFFHWENFLSIFTLLWPFQAIFWRWSSNPRFMVKIPSIFWRLWNNPRFMPETPSIPDDSQTTKIIPVLVTWKNDRSRRRVSKRVSQKTGLQIIKLFWPVQENYPYFVVENWPVQEKGVHKRLSCKFWPVQENHP